MPNITNAFFSCLAYEIETYLFEKNYSVFICNSGNTAEKEIDYFRTLAGKCVDGILCISALDRIPEDITARQIPIVCIDRQPKAAVPLPWIGNDGKNASCSATSHLLDKGCRHILFITTYLDSYNRLDRRASGWYYCRQRVCRTGRHVCIAEKRHLCTGGCADCMF